MSRIWPWQGLLMNLNQEIKPGRREYLSRDAALAQLKAWTGQDFGYNVEQWRNWLKRHRFLQDEPG